MGSKMEPPCVTPVPSEVLALQATEALQRRELSHEFCRRIFLMFCGCPEAFDDRIIDP